MAIAFSTKQRLGCWWNERWSTEIALRFPELGRSIGPRWLDLKNRNERISVDPVSLGRVCHWADSSPLTVARMFPKVGARILRECLLRWPVAFYDCRDPTSLSVPEVSFVIGVRGTRRLGQFQAVIRSIWAQKGSAVEIVVVEQSTTREFESVVGPYVKYVHTPMTCSKMPYNRSWALNAGVVAASGRIVVLHDADMVIPTRFASSIVRIMREGIQALRLPRLIFYLDQESSESVQQTGCFDGVQQIERVVQNNPTPMAITRDAYLQIGGHDESFYGWGGEDNEFLDRVRTLRLCEGSFLPVFHLWHEEAPNRTGDRNAEHLRLCRTVPPEQRISLLSRRPFGQRTPSVLWTKSQESGDI